MPLWPGTDDSDRNGQRRSKNLPLYGRVPCSDRFLLCQWIYMLGRLKSPTA